jgi:protein-arginine kinase activator protein McsA
VTLTFGIVVKVFLYNKKMAHFKTCKKCGVSFNTPFKFGRVCIHCMDKKSNGYYNRLKMWHFEHDNFPKRRLI